MSDLLSQELLRYADQLEREFLEDASPVDRRDWPIHKKFVENIVSALISARETVWSTDLTDFERFSSENREMVDGLLDSHYTILGLNRVHSLVARTMRLAQLQAKYAPSPQSNSYIQEAARAYISGLPMASVAMSRAALEQALKDRVGKQGDGDRDTTFAKLANYARKWKILDEADTKRSKDLADECNRLLHEKPIESDDKAFEILAAIRTLIQKIYSAEGGF